MKSLTRSWISITLALILIAACQAQIAKPNIVLFISDDLTWFDIGCYGGQARTPNIDKLASEGLRFTQCYQAVAVCSPTRQNLYTGLYPVKSGAYPQGSFVKAGTQSVAHYLKALGYRVGFIGKRHFNPPEAYPFEFLDDGSGDFDYTLIGKFLADVKNQPFFLIAACREPHYAWNHGDPAHYPPESLKLPPNWIDTADTRLYYSKYMAETEYMDGQLGQVIQQLKQHHLTRPAVELYDRSNDPFEMDNLAGQTQYSAVENRLKTKLQEWMAYCGDKGQETEMEALEHQWKNYRMVTENKVN